MKLTKKQIDIIRENTPKELKGQHLSVWDRLGYYQKTGANWSYVAGYVEHNGQKVLVVTVFGEVV